MEQKTKSLRELKQRKMLLVLPLLTLPFITLLFWTLGGGKTTIDQTGTQEKGGFNIDLPEPEFKMDEELDKMSYYDQAAVDSVKRQEQIRKDPNYSAEAFLDDSESMESEVSSSEYKSARGGKSALKVNSFKDTNEEKVYQKLEALQKVISQPPSVAESGQDMSEFENHYSTRGESDDVKKLEAMMSSMNQPQQPDPELKQLGGMLENILDIQHPARVEERLKQSSEIGKGKIFAVEHKKVGDNITLLQETGNIQNSDLLANSFYAFDESAVENGQQNAIEAVVHETQTIVNGSVVKLRLVSDVFVRGSMVPKNSFLFGTAALKGERLEVKINTIKYKNSIFPVDLSVYDMDGISGIYIPGTINRDVAKASADRSIQTLGLSGLDDSWGAQAAGVGIEAAKSLMSKKVKLIKVVVKAGYQVLLYDEKQKNVN